MVEECAAVTILNLRYHTQFGRYGILKLLVIKVTVILEYMILHIQQGGSYKLYGLKSGIEMAGVLHLLNQRVGDRLSCLVVECVLL